MVINIVVAVIVFVVVLLHFVVSSVFDVASCNFKHLSVLIVTVIDVTVIVLLLSSLLLRPSLTWFIFRLVIYAFVVVVVLFGLFVLIPVVTFYVQISFHRYFCNWWKLFMLSLWHCMIYNLDFLLTCCIVGFLCMINIINDKDLFLEKKNPCYSKIYMYVFTQCRFLYFSLVRTELNLPGMS